MFHEPLTCTEQGFARSSPAGPIAFTTPWHGANRRRGQGTLSHEATETERVRMREQFHEELDALSDLMVEMTRLVGSAVNRATIALLDADLALAESVIAADEAVDALQVQLEERSMALLVRQAPVATDLRVVVTGAADERRPGADGRPGPARRQARPAALPELGVPPELRATILQMGQVAERIVAKAGSVIASRDVDRRRGARDRRRRDGQPAPRPVHGAARRPTGSTASRPPSTSRCAAASTSGSPTTPSRWPAA